MNQFLIELQAILNTEISKGNINKSITRLQNQINKLKLQAEIDPKTIFNLKRQIEKATNQSITFSNINLNSGQIEKAGQQIGKGLNKGLLSSLGSIKNSINNVIKEFNDKKITFPDLAKEFNLNRPDIDNSVLEKVRGLTKEINALSKEVMKTGADSSWEGIIDKINSLYSVLNQFGKTRDSASFQESLDILRQLEGKKIFVNSKSELFQNTGMGIRELNNQFRSLNVLFTTSKKNAVDLDTVWGELCNTSPNLEKFTAFGDRINAVVEHLKTAKKALHGNDNLQPLQGNEVSTVLLGYMGRLEEASKRLNLLREQETEIKQNSVSAADTVVQNEGRKQQAYKQTADVQQQIIANESLIKSGANVMMFDNTNDAARQASQYFKELLQDEQTLISVSEKFDKSNQLSSFAVNVKRASGEVETLRYALENIGTKSDPTYVFKNVSAELNNAQAIKQMQKMEKVITDYETKLNDFKTRYSKTAIDFSGFESVFNNFKDGTGTVNDLKLAFNQLENSAKMGMQSLKSQKASLDPIQQALNNMRDMPAMLKNLETNMSGIQDRTAMAGISVSDLSARYMKLKAEMDAASGKIPLDGSWAKEYQKLMSDVVAATRQATAEQAKMGRQSKSLFASLKSGMSFLSYYTSLRYVFMQAVRGIKEVVGNVRELEDALVNVNYTMDVSGRELEEIGRSSLQMAKDLNTSASNILSAVKLYANAKESADSILQKSRPAIMLSNVTGMTGEKSAKMLQSIMNQFDMTQDDLMEIADTIEMVSQNMAYDFASGIDEIANGIEQSGSVAKSAGLSLQEYVSMLGLAIEKTGQSGSTIGNAYKTILQRITKASATEGTLEEDISAAEKSLRAVGVEVRDTADEFRDLTDIMSDLGRVWDSLSSVEQSNISYNVAGVRQTNILKSLLGYWEDYESLVEKANDAGGTTLKNQEIYAESLKGKLGELSAIWSNISDDTISSPFLKGLADAGIGVSSLIEKIGLLKTAMGIGLAGIFGKGRSNDFAL